RVALERSNSTRRRRQSAVRDGRAKLKFTHAPTALGFLRFSQIDHRRVRDRIGRITGGLQPEQVLRQAVRTTARIERLKKVFLETDPLRSHLNPLLSCSSLVYGKPCRPRHGLRPRDQRMVMTPDASALLEILRAGRLQQLEGALQ